ncbi:MAG: methyltransferase [Acidobacteriota bacterium]
MTPSAPTPGITLDRLAVDWWIYQAERGQRYSTDDVVTAWEASRTPRVATILDLGAGVGSIGLLVLARHPDARLTSIERLEGSVALLRRTVAANRLEDRVEIIAADLRTPDVLGPRRFDLVVANPPYLPRGRATVSPHPARAAARIELHGDIRDYCRIAARHLRQDGRFCLCHPAADPRTEAAITAAGMAVQSRRDVVFRHGEPPRLTIRVCGLARGSALAYPPLVIRGESRDRTEEFRAVRRELGIDA